MLVAEAFDEGTRPFLLFCLQQTLGAAALVEGLNAHKSLLIKKVPHSENNLNKHTDPE